MNFFMFLLWLVLFIWVVRLLSSLRKHGYILNPNKNKELKQLQFLTSIAIYDFFKQGESIPYIAKRMYLMTKPQVPNYRYKYALNTVTSVVFSCYQILVSEREENEIV